MDVQPRRGSRSQDVGTLLQGPARSSTSWSQWQPTVDAPGLLYSYWEKAPSDTIQPPCAGLCFLVSPPCFVSPAHRALIFAFYLFLSHYRLQW